MNKKYGANKPLKKLEFLELSELQKKKHFQLVTQSKR